MQANRITLLVGFIVSMLFPALSQAQQANQISLAGTWELRLDPQDTGLKAHWWNGKFNDQVRLPGSLTENDKGNKVTLETPWTGDIFDSTYFKSDAFKKYRTGDIKIPFWLKPNKYYAGVAWYRRTIDIPENWSKKRIILHLERCHWETSVFINGQFSGSQNSLVAPHDYEVGTYLKPGKNVITIRVDNRTKLHIGPNSHSIADHTQTNWNGLVGDLSLQMSEPTHISQVKIYPKLSSQSIDVIVALTQKRHQSFTGKLIVKVKPIKGSATALPVFSKEVSFSSEKTEITANYAIANALLWDEFNPNLYELEVQLQDQGGKTIHQRTDTFGMREVGTQGTHITINGKPVFLRGDVECATFPLTGYPPTTPAYWEKIMKTAQSYGLNHLRFHSWCPPEVAFEVADRLGMYLYVESPLWANQGSAVGTDGLIDDFIYRESERILDTYGNHPSFCLMSYGNEPGGPNQNDFLGRWIDYFKAKDTRRIYTSGAGWPALAENQFHILPEARIQRWGEGLKSIINSHAPKTSYDWREITAFSKVPYVSHEIGQWCVFPNFSEIPKYTGVVKPTNFEIFQESLKEHGMAHQADDFLKASGRLQTLCYKADIEAALRTPGFGGFQLLGLHDFPGQGTALVGALDVFWESKGYTTPEEYRTFCNPTVLLSRMDKMVYVNSDRFNAELEIAHFGAKELRNQTVVWKIVNQAGKTIRTGSLQKETITFANCQPIGNISFDLAGIKKAEQLQLIVSLKGTAIQNHWDFWVYPDQPVAESGKVLITHELNADVLTELENGASVLWLPYGKIRNGKGAEVAIGFSTVFWNTSWTNNQPPHTLGILCDPKHPLFAQFPTQYHSNYQWWDLVSKSQTIRLDGLGQSIKPLVQPIDTWFENRKLSLAFEGRIGKGKLMVCSVDLESDLGNRPAARQFRHSLLSYLNSAKFNPTQVLQTSDLQALVN